MFWATHTADASPSPHSRCKKKDCDGDTVDIILFPLFEPLICCCCLFFFFFSIFFLSANTSNSQSTLFRTLEYFTPKGLKEEREVTHLRLVLENLQFFSYWKFYRVQNILRQKSIHNKSAIQLYSSIACGFSNFILFSTDINYVAFAWLKSIAM